MFVKEFVRVSYEENSPGVGDRSQTVEAVSENNLVCQSVNCNGLSFSLNFQ